MMPQDSWDTALTDRISGAGRAGPWKMPAAARFIVIAGSGLAAGLTAQ